MILIETPIKGFVHHRKLGILWVLNLFDGYHPVLEIVERSGQQFRVVVAALDSLVAAGVLKAFQGEPA